MRQEEPGLGGPLGPLSALRARSSPSRPPRRATGWGGWAWKRRTTACRPLLKLNPPPLSHHWLVLFARPPENWTWCMKG